MKSIYESIMDVDSNIDNMNLYDILHARNKKEYNDRSNNVYNILKKYPAKVSNKKYDWVDQKTDLKPRKWYVNITNNSDGPIFDFYIKGWGEFIRIYYNAVSGVQLQQKLNTDSLLSMSTFKIPKQLEGWMNKIYGEYEEVI